MMMSYGAIYVVWVLALSGVTVTVTGLFQAAVVIWSGATVARLGSDTDRLRITLPLGTVASCTVNVMGGPPFVVDRPLGGLTMMAGRSSMIVTGSGAGATAGG